MYKTVQNCNHCGANLSLDDMRRTDCPYCGTVYPHHSQAAQHAQMASQMMNNVVAQQAQIQNQWRGAFGMPPQGAPGHGPPGTAPGPGAVPGPGAPAPGAANPPGYPGAPGSPYASPQQLVQAQVQHAQHMTRNVMLIVVVISIGASVLVGAIVVAIVLMR